MLAWWGCLVAGLWPLACVCGYASHKSQQYRSVQEPMLHPVMLPAYLQIVPCMSDMTCQTYVILFSVSVSRSCSLKLA